MNALTERSGRFLLGLRNSVAAGGSVRLPLDGGQGGGGQPV